MMSSYGYGVRVVLCRIPPLCPPLFFLTFMEHDFVDRRSQFLLSELYCAMPSLLSAVGWHSDHVGNVLVEKRTTGNAVASVVGRVLPMHLNCGPRGNFINLGYGSLQTSKFELYILKSIGSVFARLPFFFF
ncbi:hypothetical protein EDB87DRAFT_1621891 [Lactarius vividus]|nr:hypothetical protein EDB87DRAFT_1621891 [Lactarius vividus]